MKKLILVLIGFLCFTLAKGQTYSSITSDQEIYAFMNWMITYYKKFPEAPKLKRKQIYYKIAKWDTANFITKDSALINKYPYYGDDFRYIYQRRGGTDTLFKPQDRAFLFKQFTAIKDTVWRERFSKSKLLTNKKQRRPNRYYYSIPLFSADKQYVIIFQQYYCGSLCAHGGYYVYRRIDDKHWEIVTAVNTWIS